MFSPLEKNVAIEKAILKTDNAFKSNKFQCHVSWASCTSSITAFKEQTKSLNLGCKTGTGKFLSVRFPKSPDDVMEPAEKDQLEFWS